MLSFELTKDTPYLALSGELWSVFYEYFNRNWSCYKGFLLYCSPEIRSLKPEVNTFSISEVSPFVMKVSVIISIFDMVHCSQAAVLPVNYDYDIWQSILIILKKKLKKKKLEILPRSMISAIHEFRENILSVSWKDGVAMRLVESWGLLLHSSEIGSEGIWLYIASQL